MTLSAVRFLDHTADVGIDVAAESLPELFERAAAGMLALLRGDDDAPLDAARASGPVAGPAPTDTEGHDLELEAAGPAELLAAWLRELLFLHEVPSRDFVSARWTRLDPGRLEARVETRPSLPAVREIKGVTYHELEVRPAGSGWTARIIFDV